VPLIKNAKLTDDPWQAVGEGEPLPAEGPVLVDLARWRAERDALIARGTKLGIRLASDQSPEGIADDLSHFELCALEFPAFTDGRAYSYARLLRERYAFAGEIRAIGDVLLEQLHFMDRAGFDAFEVSSEPPIEDWETAQADLDIWYQPTGDGRPTAAQLRRS
jgi:uncharacterized protein (DUF934 family)